MSGENALHYCARNGSTIMIHKILQAAELSPSGIQELLSQTNVKLKFPEDVAKNQLTREVLKDYRKTGMHIIEKKIKKPINIK
jgi:ankyrin repeat protein